MARVFLVEGPVGSGKSTFAVKLSQDHDALRFTLDDWMRTLFAPDRPDSEVIPWYLERKARCIEQIWKLTRDLLDAGHNAVLELGLIQTQARQDFYARVDAAGYALSVFVMDAPREIRRQRVMERNERKGATFSVEVPEAFFELASDMWQPPDDEESAERNIQWIATGQ